MELGSPARSFIKSVKVETSTDGVNWTRIAECRPIFRIPAGAENMRIDFPQTACTWFRLTLNDQRTLPIPINSASRLASI